MARIRTVKPEFFRDEDLQDLELKHPDAKPMLVFEGLWGHCDKQGVFEWKPRVLKLDILPFLPFDMETTLGILEAAGLVEKFEFEGKVYGLIDSFPGHQRIGGKEHSDPAKYPGKPRKHRGSNGEAPEQQPGAQEGKGRDLEGRGMEGKGREGAPPVDNPSDPSPSKAGNFSGKNALPQEPSPRNGSSKVLRAVERRNGSFEEINDTVEKLIRDWQIPVTETGRLAQMAHISEDQVKVSIEQLRDRGRLPGKAA